jgi:hypothetical protein
LGGKKNRVKKKKEKRLFLSLPSVASKTKNAPQTETLTANSDKVGA